MFEDRYELASCYDDNTDDSEHSLPWFDRRDKDFQALQERLFLLHDCWLHSSIMSISGEKYSGCSLFGSKIVYSIMV